MSVYIGGQLAGGSKMSNVLKASEDLLKTPEQLEEDKRHILSNRIPKMSLDGKGKDALIKTVSLKILKFFWPFFYLNFSRSKSSTLN